MLIKSDNDATLVSSLSYNLAHRIDNTGLEHAGSEDFLIKGYKEIAPQILAQYNRSDPIEFFETTDIRDILALCIMFNELPYLDPEIFSTKEQEDYLVWHRRFQIGCLRFNFPDILTTAISKSDELNFKDISTLSYAHAFLFLAVAYQNQGKPGIYKFDQRVLEPMLCVFEGAMDLYNAWARATAIKILLAAARGFDLNEAGTTELTTTILDVSNDDEEFRYNLLLELLGKVIWDTDLHRLYKYKTFTASRNPRNIYRLKVVLNILYKEIVKSEYLNELDGIERVINMLSKYQITQELVSKSHPEINDMLALLDEAIEVKKAGGYDEIFKTNFLTKR